METIENKKAAVLKGLGKIMSEVDNPLLETEWASHPDRLQFINRIKVIDKEVYDKLVSGELQIEDVILFSTQEPADGVTSFEVFKTDDQEKPGFCNVVQAKLANPAMIFAIMLEYSDAAAGAFVPAAPIATLMNGTFEWGIEGKRLIKTGMHAFLNPEAYAADTKTRALVLKLRNPKYLKAQKEIKFDVKLKNALAAATADHQVRVSLIGLSVNSNNAQ